MRHINEAGRQLIKGFEALRLTAYRDQKGVWTIGWGHTAAAGAPIPGPGMTITLAEAEEIFSRDIAGFEEAVWRETKGITLNDNQFAALVSLCFNIGAAGFASSTTLRCLKEGDWKGAADGILLWNKITVKDDDGKEVKITSDGLVNRRNLERNLFLRALTVKSAAVAKAQETLNNMGATLKVDGDKGPVTGQAIRQVKAAAAEASKGSALAIGSTLTVGGVVAIVQAVWSLWQGNAEALTSGDTQAVIGGAVALGFGLFKIGQNVWDRWGG